MTLHCNHHNKHGHTLLSYTRTHATPGPSRQRRSALQVLVRGRIQKIERSVRLQRGAIAFAFPGVRLSIGLACTRTRRSTIVGHVLREWGFKVECNPCLPHAQVFKVNTETKEVERNFVGPHRLTGEPIFAPDRGQAADAEDKGWVLSMVHDGKEKCTELHVLDAQVREVLCELWCGTCYRFAAT